MRPFSRSLRRFAHPAPAATCVSEPLAARALEPRESRLSQALARPSLCAVLAIMPSACLVTSVPEYDEPAQTPPFLVAAAADPDPREFTVILDAELRKDFRAAVISEDRSQPVQIALYIDYGVENAAGNPFRRSIAEFPEIPAGTLADGKRPVHAEWFLDSDDVGHGCHTVTMMVTHEFDFRNCPARLTDSSSLMWHVLRCPSTDLCDYDPQTDCPNSAAAELVGCPPEDAASPEGESGGGQ